MPALVSALKSVDLPTLGRPTMPHWMAILYSVKSTAAPPAREQEVKGQAGRLRGLQRVKSEVAHLGNL
jgi:hypothetical protein